MGKRTRSGDDTDIECIAKKLKRLERKLLRARRRKHKRAASPPSSSSSSNSSSSSSSSLESPRRIRSLPPEPLYIEDAPSIDHEPGPSTSADIGLQDLQSSVPAVTDSQQSTSAGVNLQLPAHDLPKPMDQPSTSEMVHLDEGILQILGTDPSQTVLYGEDIQSDLASRLQYMATSGLTKENRKELLDKYLPPGNCKQINAPVLNPEVKIAVSETVFKRDKGIEQKQKLLCSGISCIAQALTLVIKSEPGNLTLIKLLMDGTKILCDLQNADSITRRNFVLFNLKKELKDQLQSTKIDEFLFGHELAETLKTAKAISKSGADMKISSVKPSSKKSSVPTQRNLNWQGPPPSHRPKGPQRTKEPVNRRRPYNSSKQSSRPAATNRGR